MNYVTKTIRFAGGGMNLVALLTFICAAFAFYGLTSDLIARAGGIPELTAAGIEQFLRAPKAAERIGFLAAAWASFVGTLGCAWMSAIGLRWAYHALLRMTMRPN